LKTKSAFPAKNSWTERFLCEKQGHSFEVRAALCKMDPVRAAETIEDINDDLDWGNIPTERVSYSAFKDAQS
jgi:hypothetical protein